MAVKLNLRKETVTCLEKGLKFGPIGFSTWQCPSLRGCVKQFRAQ